MLSTSNKYVTNTRLRVGALLVFLGAAGAMIGPFMSWARVILTPNAPIGKPLVLHPNGWNGDGTVVFSLGVVAAIVGAVLLWRDAGRIGVLLRSAVLCFGVAIVVVTFWDTTHVSSRFGHVVHQLAADKRLGGLAPQVRTRVDPGIIIAAGGGVLMIFAAVVDRLLAEPIIIEVEE